MLFYVGSECWKIIIPFSCIGAGTSQAWLEEIKDEWWGELFSGNSIWVMSYHQFGYQMQERSGFLKDIGVAVYDEMHNL